MFNIDWERYRLVDVTLRVVPGEGDRRLELRRYTFPVDGSFGYEVDTVTHLGTHIEAPAHYYTDGNDVCAYPPDLFMGRMLNLRFSDIAPNDTITESMMRHMCQGYELSDAIAVVSSPHFRSDVAKDDRAVLSHEAAKYLVTSGIRLMGFDDSITIDTSAALAQAVHRELFDNGVLIVEYMGQLGELTQKESYLIALPMRIVGFDSSPVRAIVIEER